MQEYYVGKLADLGDDKAVLLQTGDRIIGVFNVAGKVLAYDNRCPHMGGPVCQGDVMPWVVDVIAEDQTVVGERITEEKHLACPWHGFEFDLVTGQCMANPGLHLRKYQAVVRGEDIYVLAP